MAKREFSMLAKVFDAKKHMITGTFISEKLDGMRAIWDGGVSRDIPKIQVPWGNQDKDDRYEDAPIATGLWSRYGNVIHAPDWWLDMLPPFPLDGELYAPGERQKLMSVVKHIVPGPHWDRISYRVFDSPPAELLFGDGTINAGPNFQTVVVGGLEFWELKANQLGISSRSRDSMFVDVQRWMRSNVDENQVVTVHDQTQLPYGRELALGKLNEFLAEILGRGGEGIIIRDEHSAWIPERTKSLLKVKPRKDSEATVIGYTWAEVGKIEGRMGSLKVRWTNPLGQKVHFSIGSGFTDEERALVGTPGSPGSDADSSINSKHFPLNEQVTFKYRTLTADGNPEEISHYRKHIRDV